MRPLPPDFMPPSPRELRERRLVLLIIIGVLGILFACLVGSGMESARQARREEAALLPTAAERQITAELAARVPDCPAVGNHGMTLAGKVLVWDLDREDLFDLYPKAFRREDYRLADRLVRMDEPVTVFLIHKRQEAVGHYGISPSAGAYRTYADIGVAAWPEKRLVGFATVSAEPPEKTVTTGGWGRRAT